ncbi:MAG: restriction endonuclease [Candidatus Aenigmarchaeota archaeon]|nr:restriction endonuclease [Candidatus Aenigmarchaeota archaeon]
MKLKDVHSGNSRQFDVVIRYGIPERQFVAVVEVQDRNEKVGIETLQSWIEKMKSVGAHRLICVSTAGYTQPAITEAVTKYGPFISLMTLEELKRASYPLPLLLDYAPVRIPNLRVVKAPHITLEEPPVHPMSFSWRDNVFITEKSQRKSMRDLLLEFINRSDKSYSKGCHIENLELKPPDLWFDHQGIRRKVAVITATIALDVREERLPLNISKYEKKEVNGQLAWVMNFRGVIDEKEIDVNFVFLPESEGRYRLATVGGDGIDNFSMIKISAKNKSGERVFILKRD